MLPREITSGSLGRKFEPIPGVSISVVRTADNRWRSFASNGRQSRMIKLRKSNIIHRLASLDVLILN